MAGQSKARQAAYNPTPVRCEKKLNRGCSGITKRLRLQTRLFDNTRPPAPRYPVIMTRESTSVVRTCLPMSWVVLYNVRARDASTSACAVASF